MADKEEVLRRNREHQRDMAHRKAEEAIRVLKAERRPINFSSVSKKSGVSRSFLYGDAEIHQIIEDCREMCIEHEMNRRAKYDKTSQSKDVIIKAKDKRIARLEEENERLKTELKHLRGLLYERK